MEVRVNSIQILRGRTEPSSPRVSPVHAHLRHVPGRPSRVRPGTCRLRTLLERNACRTHRSPRIRIASDFRRAGRSGPSSRSISKRISVVSGSRYERNGCSSGLPGERVDPPGFSRAGDSGSPGSGAGWEPSMFHRIFPASPGSESTWTRRSSDGSEARGRLG